MRKRAWRAASALGAVGAVVALLPLTTPLLAQTPAPSADPFGIQGARKSNPFGATPSSGAAPPTSTSTPPAAVAVPSPVIATVENRPIRQSDFDRIAIPYFATLKGQYGAGFTGDILTIANLNVLDELIRRELLAVEVSRQKIDVTQAEIDAVLMPEPFFQTDGKFDAQKLARYKSDPASNYQQMLPRVRETAAMRKLDESLRKRFAPTPPEVRSEWSRLNDEVRLSLLPLLTRDMSWEPEATQAEWAQYYKAHPDQFVQRTRVRLRYARLPLPVATDSTRAAEETRAFVRAKGIADSLRAGTLPDTATGFVDSGPFEIPAQAIPGIGRAQALSDTLAKVEADSTIRVVGPYLVQDMVVVGKVVDRDPQHVPPMREVLGDVKRRADQEKRRVATEADRLAFYQSNRDRWRITRASLTRVNGKVSAFTVKPPQPQEVDRWYAQHGHVLFGMPDTSKSWMPPISDSMRTVARARMIDDERRRHISEASRPIVAGMKSTGDVRSLAKASGAVAETLSFEKGGARDSLFGPGFIDSLLTSSVATRGTVQGPRAFGNHWVVWRVDVADTSYVPPMESIRERVDQEFSDDRRKQDETEAKAYFDDHRSEFKTSVKYGLDYVAVRVMPADSVRISEAELKKQYDANPTLYRQEEQIKARHILFSAREPGTDVDRKAKARADSLLAAIRKNGGDFAELAKRFSQEPGAESSGGDLGWFGRGRMVKPFEDAVFALKPGEISAVIKSVFGYHIILVEDHKPAGVKPFAEVRNQIRQQMAQSRADTTARRAAAALRRQIAAGGNPKSLSARYGGVVAAKPVAANESLPDIGFPQGLGQDLPTLGVGKWAPKVYRTGASYLVLRVREKLPQRPAEFEEAKAAAIEAMRNAKRTAVLEHKALEIRSALAAGGALDSLAAPYGGLKDSGLLSRTASFLPMLGPEPRVVQKAFTMNAGQVSDTLRVAQGIAWLRIDEKKKGDPATFKASAPAIEAQLAKKRYDAWVEEKKKTVKIEILRPDLRAPRPSPFSAMLGGG